MAHPAAPVHALFLNPALGAHHSQHCGEALSNSPAWIDGAAPRAPVCAPVKPDKSPAVTPALKGLRQSLHSGPPEATSAWPMTMQHPRFLKERFQERGQRGKLRDTSWRSWALN